MSEPTSDGSGAPAGGAIPSAHPPLRLTAELVPRTSWYDNLRNLMAREDWDALRRRVYARYGHRCATCGADARLHCHEIWEYDDEHHVQALRGFVALCEMCHHVKHLGLAGILASEGRLDFDRLIGHFCDVNQCDRPVFERHRAEAFTRWRERSKHAWTVDLGEWAGLVRTPAANGAADRTSPKTGYQDVTKTPQLASDKSSNGNHIDGGPHCSSRFFRVREAR